MSRAQRRAARQPRRGLRPGEIVDIRWGDQRDRDWLRAALPAREWREFLELPQWLRREMSVYRCAECGVYGALEGIGDETLLLWTTKRKRCQACLGCDCEQCRADRAAAS